MLQYLFAGLVNGNIAIYTKAEGNVVIWFDNILRNLHVSIFWHKQFSTTILFLSVELLK